MRKNPLLSSAVCVLLSIAVATPAAAHSPGTRLSMLGADVSSLEHSEDLGGAYYYENGKQADALQILKSHGVNYIRLRAWVDPSNGYNDKASVLEMAKRARAKGMKFYLNLHYSDRWADGAHQTKPAAWAGHTFEQLQSDVYDYTYDMCVSLKRQGTPASMISIGNEIQSGMLWPEGSTWDWTKLGALLKQGYDAVKACDRHALVMLHLADGGDNNLYRTWFDNAVAHGVKFDVIGLSYYGIWHGPIAALQANMNDVAARYGKPVVVAETAYPWTLGWNDNEGNVCCYESQLQEGYPATPEGQRANLRDVLQAVRDVPGGKGLGAFWWEPTWTAVPGNGWDPDNPASGDSWENMTLFDFASHALPAMSEFRP
ncbi:arabinogalactan endo-1,4-beta-galactosidase [Hamadaea sp. NPDC051192]|uniref:glycoside hydrolase family 53 protein n=1 Tax=Hamadaea sp. NPDC051192 TaxID=3154940 RepID=UPI00343A8D7F